MSNRALNEVWRHSRAQPLDRLVLLALADLTNDEQGSGVAWPAVATLMRMTGLSRRGVQSAITRLEKSGELIADRRGGRDKTSRYCVTIGRPLAELRRVCEDWGFSAEYTTKLLQNVERAREKGDTACTLYDEKGARHDTLYAKRAHATTPFKAKGRTPRHPLSEKGRTPRHPLSEKAPKSEKGARHDTLYDEKGARHDTLYGEKGARHDTQSLNLTTLTLNQKQSLTKGAGDLTPDDLEMARHTVSAILRLPGLRVKRVNSHLEFETGIFEDYQRASTEAGRNIAARELLTRCGLRVPFDFTYRDRDRSP